MAIGNRNVHPTVIVCGAFINDVRTESRREVIRRVPALTLFYHEGIMGHRLQYAIQTKLKGDPAFCKFGGVKAYTEGWGLYSEGLAKEMDADPARDFGLLQLELHRVIRLVVDSGLHFTVLKLGPAPLPRLAMVGVTA